MQISIWTSNPKHNGVTTNLDANTGDKVAMGNFLSGLAAFNPSFVTFDPNVDTVKWGLRTAGAGRAGGVELQHC